MKNATMDDASIPSQFRSKVTKDNQKSSEIFITEKPKFNKNGGIIFSQKDHEIPNQHLSYADRSSHHSSESEEDDETLQMKQEHGTKTR